MKKTKTVAKKTSWFRVILGTLVAYAVNILIGFLIFMAQGWGIVNASEAILAWIFFPLLSIILLLYNYGWLGMWLIEMEDSRSAILRIIGKTLGALGYILHPYPLWAFGANKKYLFNIFVTFPLAAFGIVLIILGAVGTNVLPLPAELSGDWSSFYYIYGVFTLFNALFAFLTKKCPNCGCLMSKISYETKSYGAETYTQQYSRKIGSVSDQYGNTADVNELYDVEREGHANTVVKTFTCKNCGSLRQGRATTIHTMSMDDHRRYS